MKPKLLVLELWGLGDLVLASPFLRTAAEGYAVTLLAKPQAGVLAKRFWPGVEVIPFVAPWTAFRGKYQVWTPPWWRLGGTISGLRQLHFDAAASVRPDPRDHLLMRLAGAKRRYGFPRAGGAGLLSDCLDRPGWNEHRAAGWRRLGRALGFEVPVTVRGGRQRGGGPKRVVVHSGAGHPVRVWPLERYSEVVGRLRAMGLQVSVICDSPQEASWRALGEEAVEAPGSLERIIEVLEGADLFVGNDSGPGHLAALIGVPTFTVFGPQRPEWFAPVHPDSEWIEGVDCPWKPCWDACCFAEPFCLTRRSVGEVWSVLEAQLQRLEARGRRGGARA